MIVRYPKIGQLLENTILDAKLDIIRSRDYKTLKQRLIVIDVLLTELEGLYPAKRSEVIQLVLEGKWPRVESILDGHQPKLKSNAWFNFISLPTIFSKDSSPGQALLQRARSIATHTPDVDFLLQLKSISARDAALQTPVETTEDIIQDHFNATIGKLLNKLVHSALRVQLEECAKQIEREASSDAERDITRFRNDFRHQIERLSQSESTS